MAGTLEFQAQVNSHYTPPKLAEAILEGLRRAGKAERLSPDDLAPLDQFHSRGKLATVELARRAGLQPGMRVLDVGGGLGGPARTLAAEFGCDVTVLDITEEYCRVGEMLTHRTGQSERVTFRCGSALDMPFDAASFDVVWTQHSTMNIEDKERLYSEARRVLGPQGRLAAYEVVAGPEQPIHFPVPWAREPALSFLRPADSMRALMTKAGFTEESFDDNTATALAWFRERMAAMPPTPPPLGLHLLLGETFKPAFQNLVKNIEQSRVAVIQLVYRRE